MSATALSDDEIAQRVLRGEPELFELLMRRHNPKVYRAVRSLLRDEDEAEDAMQQAYVQAYLHLGQRAGTSALGTWLTRIAINEALMRLRRTRRVDLSEGAEDVAETKRGPEEEVARIELGGLLQRAVESLPERYRVVFILREVEGLSTADTASAIDVSEDVVKTRLHRAKAMLQERLIAQAPVAELYPFPATRCDRVVNRVMERILAQPLPAQQ